MKYDIAVIGGGASGMMAAGRAGELGANVVLLEKNSKLGIKLLATGGGRANITNLSDKRELAASFGKSGAWLLSGLSKFGPEELIEFLNSRGLKTKIEDSGRVFPKSNSAQDVLRTLLDYLDSSGVDIKLGAEVKKIVKVGDNIQKIILADGREVTANKFIICTGGKSYPLTGSTGDAYKWLKQLGHEIIPPRPALVPIILKDKFVRDLEGLSLDDTKINCYQNNKKLCLARGSIMFTGNGLSGPAVLNLSEVIGRVDPKGLELRLDFLPELSADELYHKFQLEFSSSNKMYKNALTELVPPKLVDTIINLSGVDPHKKLNLVSRAERKALVGLLKEFSLTIFGLAGYDRAMVTAGGVSLKEVDGRTMRSKIVSNLYLAGEILDLNGPTGGYNLQLCWTSGYLAGESEAS
ncbi:aminoacetone oxidase family FAD-binding enzyme [Candidatus Falkowbacteria bacterium CG10_big_fil_rev_8_21_14_0_10_39_9]|uniref:Aminoacetone oxidase family FAD-binding enzyme n=1 Tax=Candidatus Falkowbacteria bacterium CG10_big_fil_rev_8_21_14_0_10_39_9 TaxID=1974566 RepID=A0A2M6WRE7_9BACT|nr:MAG: aminoacetone oxidase family FAD-binding enzyme [Candidatus Falkowbacteria bacterium CG10_big_fil_rev_8_21_14_0_10_39_9]